MRDIVDIVVPGSPRQSELITRKAGRVRFWGASTVPLVVAVSGVATDRFPSRLSSKRYRGNVSRYSYIGPRTDNNLVSRVQAVQQIAAAILAEHETLKSRSSQLRGAFSILKLHPGMYFELTVDQTLGAEWSASRVKQAIESSRAHVHGDALHGDLLQRCARFLKRRKRAQIRLDLDNSKVVDVGYSNADVLHLLLQIGVLRIGDCNVINTKGEHLDLKELSSGQWHLLSSLVFVAATVKDNTLLLMDEPENSLHPAWQQQYLPLLQKAINSSKGVHVVVSTHSPHVASSLSPEVAEVIALRCGRSLVTAKPLASGPYGWAADDILRVAFGLETTRSRAFSRKMDATLKLFAKGNRKNPDLVKKVQALEAIAPNLPEDDAVREMIYTMAVLIQCDTED